MDTAKEILAEAAARGVEMLLPDDVVVATYPDDRTFLTLPGVAALTAVGPSVTSSAKFTPRRGRIDLRGASAGQQVDWLSSNGLVPATA